MRKCWWQLLLSHHPWFQSICTKNLAQKHRFCPFFEKVPPWLILWLFIQLKKVWGPKLCVSLTLCPNPSVYNDIDICSFEKSHDNGRSFQHIGENSWYHEATLKNCLSCDPWKILNLAKYSQQLQSAHSQTSSKCISMIMLALPLIYKANTLRYSVFHTPSTSIVTR